MEVSDPDQAWTPPEPLAITAALVEAGLRVDPAAIELLPRDDRLAVRLPENRMAWFRGNAKGLRRLERERRVLGLIARHCQFAAPRTLYASDAGWEVRDLVAGEFNPAKVYERAKTDRSFARTVGQGLGSILVQLHTEIATEALSDGWLPVRPSWPPPLTFAEQRLPEVTDDRALIERGLNLLTRYEAAEDAIVERVLGHTDLGFHNAVIDPVSGVVGGVFDFDGAAYCDADHDFRYFLLDDEDETLLEAAVSVYEPATAKTIDRDRVRLLNAARLLSGLPSRRLRERSASRAYAGRRPALDIDGFDAGRRLRILFLSFIYILGLTHLLFAATRMVGHRRCCCCMWRRLRRGRRTDVLSPA